MRPFKMDNNEHDKLTFKTWVVNLFEDERDRTSIKPVIAFLGSLFLCGSMLVNSFEPEFVPADYLVDAVMIITAIGMGADSLDKFSLRNRGRYRNRDQDYSGYSDDYDSVPNNYTDLNSVDENIDDNSNQLL